MIVHLVLFEPRPDLSAAQRTEILEAVTAATETIPSVRRVRVGRRIRHGLPGYEQTAQPEFQYVAMLEFDDEEGLREYLRHPAHAAAGDHFTVSASAALAYDYALAPAAGMAAWLSKNV